VHKEPFSEDCSNADGTPKAEKDQAQWCKDAFCYVDPCTCNAPDVSIGVAGWFSGTMAAYSYSNCGSSDSWSNAAANQNKKAADNKAKKDTYCKTTCSKIKDYYKKAECCGMPTKQVPYPILYPFSHNVPYHEMYK